MANPTLPKCGFHPCENHTKDSQPLCPHHMQDMEFFQHMLAKVAVQGIPIIQLLATLGDMLQRARPPRDGSGPGKLFGPGGGKLR